MSPQCHRSPPIHLPNFSAKTHPTTKIFPSKSNKMPIFAFKSIHLLKFHTFWGKINHPSIYISLGAEHPYLARNCPKRYDLINFPQNPKMLGDCRSLNSLIVIH